MITPGSDLPTEPAGPLDAQTEPAAAGDTTPLSPAPPVSSAPPVGSAPPASPPAPPPLPPGNGPSGGRDYSLPMMIGVFVLALVGIGLLGLGLYAVVKLSANPALVAGSRTPTLPPLSTRVVLVPTTTPAPPATQTATPTSTAVPTTATTAATAVPLTATSSFTATATSLSPTITSGLLTIVQGVNVRSGPGTNYPVVGSLKAGDTAPVLGRNATGDWFVISLKNGPGGQGWVSANSNISTYNGDKSQLTVVAAPPVPATPVPAATPKPAGNPNGALVNGAHGVSGMLNLCSSQVTFAVNERVCFVEWIKNNTTQPVPYGLLGVTAVKNGGGAQFQTSWSGEQAAHGMLGIDPGCVGPTDRCKGEWEDGIRLGSAGGYKLYLSVCFSDYPTCRGASGDWETLSGAIDISVQ